MTITSSFDVAVVGAGIAGCHLAQLLANNNLKVCLIDSRSIEQAGPHWINAVPLWMFDEAHLERPLGNEIFDINDRFIIRAPNKRDRLVIDDLFVLDVNMARLGERLKEKFLAKKNAEFIQANITKGGYDKSLRLREISGQTEFLETINIKAQLFVDASGLKASIRKDHHFSSTIWPKIAKEDCCTAAQRTLEIIDRSLASSFLEENQINPHDVLSDVGFMGGYSLFRVQIDKDLNHISFLCGIRAASEFMSAQAFLSRFIARHKWIGKSFIEGRGAIPINGPYQQLIAPGLALLGDCANQIYAAHGSGIGIGLIAARYLSDAIVKAQKQDGDIGSIEALKYYQQKFHGKYFKRLYFAEHFRKFSQSLNETGMSSLISSGVLNESLAKQTLRQEEPTLSIPALKTLAKGALKAPKTFASVLPVFSKAITGGLHALRLGKT